MKEIKIDKLNVKISADRPAMGAAAAADISAYIKKMLSEKDELNIIFAAAPSQNEALAELVKAEGIDWGRINAYHMDEYIGLPVGAPQAFSNYLKEHIFSLVPFKSINYIDATAKAPDAEAERYSKLLKENPADMVVMGIGENGHIAFNDPPVADFNDTKAVKPVKLDEICRNQQVNDGCFATIDDVPTHAITLTVPTLYNAPRLFCIVPGPTKAWAVRETLNSSIDEHCPATILRRHDAATLYIDADSAKLL